MRVLLDVCLNAFKKRNQCDKDFKGIKEQWYADKDLVIKSIFSTDISLQTSDNLMKWQKFLNYKQISYGIIIRLVGSLLMELI